MTDLINLDTALGQVPDYMRRASELMVDPQAVQRLAIGHVQDILEGTITVTDPTNPMVTLMGVSAANCSAAVLANTASLRRRYEVLATTPEELYHHLSDVDYNGRFATPLEQKVLCLVSVTELRTKMVQQSDGSGKVTIPRYSKVTVDGIPFTLLYPVTVRELSHGSWSVHYDLSSQHPLQPMTSSVIYWTERDSQGPQTRFLQLELSMLQVRASVYSMDLTPSTGLDRTIALVDEYCSAQVWFKGQSMSQWQEIKTTHSDMVYDASVPTAVLSVIGSSFKIRIPQIYFTSGLISGKVRLALYTTQGTVYLNLSGRNLDNFQSTWSTEDNDTVTSEMAAWQAVQSKFLFFQGIASGGTPALGFEKLRQNVIDGVTVQEIPITPAQLQAALEKDGYTIRRYVDSVTSRQLIASKPLPSSRDKELITPGSATIASVLTTMTSLKASPWVADNGLRVTITPNALWQIRAGVVRMVSEQEMTDLFSQDAETRAALINTASYLYSPYYYVLDASLDRFSVRPYHLDEPSAIVDKYLGENDTTGMQIEINELRLVNTGNGWQLQVSTLSNAAWKEQDISYRHAQLNFDPAGIGASAAVNGEVSVGDNGEDVFVFHLPSGYDIDANHKISQIGFHAITPQAREVFSDLTQTFRLIFATGAPLPSTAVGHILDTAIVTADLPNRIAAVAAQQVRLSFGVHLKNLWAACRTIAPVQPWKTYPADVPAVEPIDVYEINPVTGTTVFIDSDGNPYFKKTKSAGDPVLNNGVPLMQFTKGSVIYSGGEPVAVGEDELQRQFDMLFLEGCYFFATDASTTQYTSEMIQVLTGYITKDLAQFDTRTSEATRVYFYPRVTLGSVTAMIDAGVVVQLQADQSLTVRLGVPERVSDNEVLIAQLEKKTIQVIQAYLDRDVYSTSDLIMQLQAAYAGDVLSIQVSGFGGSNNASAITLLNANERCSLKKRVFILDNGEFTVREAVSIDIFNHTSN